MIKEVKIILAGRLGYGWLYGVLCRALCFP